MTETLQETVRDIETIHDPDKNPGGYPWWLVRKDTLTEHDREFFMAIGGYNG